MHLCLLKAGSDIQLSHFTGKCQYFTTHNNNKYKWLIDLIVQLVV